MIEEIFKRFIDDGYVSWPKNVNTDVFKSYSMRYIPHWNLKKMKNSCEQNFDNFWQLLNFLDVSIILHQNGRLEIDVFFKEACMAILTASVTIRNT